MIPALSGIIRPSPKGLYCPEGDFYIDPRQPVARAVITHAHADHARPGSASYLCAEPGKTLLQTRMGRGANIRSLAYGERLRINAVVLSLHPAGHILGSAQVRLEQGGHICVVSGDYKADADPTCAPLEPQACHTFISESTFGLPIFKWPAQAQLNQEIHAWWQANQAQGRTSVLFAYALGKAQRILAGLDAAQGPILTHGAVEKITQCYRQAGIALPATRYISDGEDRRLFAKALVLTPPSADHAAWLKRFPRRSRAFASGWMRVRGNRRRRAVDRGFVLSDHSDWEGLLNTIAATGAESIGLTHGYAQELARWLNGLGRRAEVIPERIPDAGDPWEIPTEGQR
jgi:putative mRNA 3-end processing factor